MPNLKDLMQEREPIKENRTGHPPADGAREKGFGFKILFDLIK